MTCALPKESELRRHDDAGSVAVKTRKLPAPLTFRMQRLFLITVKTKTWSFRKIQDAHRKDRAEDARALKSGKISPAEL